ncbi:energy-coupling factor transporter transmembrane protein EcfT [Sporolactobacillus shoreicorticis]|uniref:Energy-coupling factor transporter transmembrane component T n=1 Tax=Sporolactobacillus shoreicorticis TaxID=1923877 RepID=A0ABW5S2D9_9BACL|nr:energy-coupling factor transporter transmembrane component T [Sporolactobacillus shoreicorticis]MCO7127053.1 energy-coupling factor transporter transmembrane protein EcfT [Sporolactobacillus shoreicorticis]
MRRPAVHVDFRAKLAVFALMFVLSALLIHDVSVCLAMLFMTLYLCAQSFYRAGIVYFLTGCTIAFLRSLPGVEGITILLPDVLLFAILRITLVIMAAYAMMRMPPGEITAAFMKMRLPSALALPITFMLRFAPTVRGEFRTVFAALRMRGLLSMTHPLRTFEYTLIPVITRSTVLSDNLAASAELRGISNPGIHSSLRLIRFQKIDSLLLLLAFGFSAICLYIDRWVMT